MTEYERITGLAADAQAQGNWDLAAQHVAALLQLGSEDKPEWLRERPRLDDLWLACIVAAAGSKDLAQMAVHAAASKAALELDNAFDVPSARGWLEYLSSALPEDSNLLLLLALVCRQEGRLDEAAVSLEAALRHYWATETPLFADPWPVFELAAKNAAQRGDREGSIAYLKQAVDCDANNAGLLVHLGNQLNLLNRFSEAVDSLRRAVALDPMNQDAHFHLGFALMRVDQHAAAVEALERAYALASAAGATGELTREAVSPCLAAALNELGADHSDDGRPRDALPFLERAAQMAPDDSDYQRNLQFCRTRAAHGLEGEAWRVHDAPSPFAATPGGPIASGSDACSPVGEARPTGLGDCLHGHWHARPAQPGREGTHYYFDAETVLMLDEGCRRVDMAYRILESDDEASTLRIWVGFGEGKGHQKGLAFSQDRRSLSEVCDFGSGPGSPTTWEYLGSETSP